MPRVDATERTCRSRAPSSMEKSGLSGLTVAANTPRNSRGRLARRGPAALSAGILEDTLETHAGLVVHLLIPLPTGDGSAAWRSVPNGDAYLPHGLDLESPDLEPALARGGTRLVSFIPRDRLRSCAGDRTTQDRLLEAGVRR